MNPLSSVGTGELILILVIALIFLGPERLPEVARSVGEAIRRFRGVLQSMSAELGDELASVQDVTRDLREGIQAVQEVRDLPRTLMSTAAAPLVKAVEPLQSAVEEAKEALDTASLSVSVRAEESVLDEVTAPLEPESVTEPGADDSHSPDEPGVVIEDDQVQ